MHGRDILDDFAQPRKSAPQIEGTQGLVIEHRRTGFTGSIAKLTTESVTLRGRMQERVFALHSGGFLFEGKPVTLVRPASKASGPVLSASGSIRVKHETQIARRSRIWVEGIHDAALIERVWGDDLRAEGIVVERLDGIDRLAEAVGAFGTTGRLGVLVDHLVSGSKEARLAQAIRQANVLVTGTPFVDVWQAVRPSVLGIERWPVIDKGQDWKTGICRSFGVTDPADMWRRLLASVQTYADLEPDLVGAVERLIDFVTAA